MRRDRAAEARVKIYKDMGEEGLELLEEYGAMRDREGSKSGLLAALMMTAIGISLWPWIKAGFLVWWSSW